MKHVHGIEIRLLDDKGRLVAEATPSKDTASNPFRFNGQIGSRNICLQPGKKFKVCITIHRDFKFYRSEGVKVVIVADGVYAGDPDQAIRQRYGMWYIRELEEGDRLGLRKERQCIIEGFTVWNRRRASQGEYADFLVPQLGDLKLANPNWMKQDHYCANPGCIAVFVERGSLVEEDEEAGISLGDRSSMPSPIPIRFDEFLELRSNNANPYIFEFRNARGALPRSSITKSDTFGGVLDDIVSDHDDLVYDTDRETDEGEDEVDATDESDSESASESGGESDTDSLISVDSYDSSPRSRGRKRKARSPANRPQRKKAKTNAEKNAEADAGNATFASSKNKKNQDADATNATFMNRSDSDRDDEERPLDVPWLKREPGIKQERSDSASALRPQKSTTKATSARKKASGMSMARRSIVDLTLDESEDEGEDVVSNGIRGLQKKLDGMAKSMESIGRRRGLK